MENKTNGQGGNISVAAENIFPVIKKWLYSDKEIFLREIVSNACDAVTKLKRLASLGQTELPEGEQFRIDVVLDKENNTLTVSDNGIGMTPEELEKYICNIALSGAMDFMAKYEKESAGNGIIGHFGLGFYSAFMVSDRVEIHTRSYLEGSAPVLWDCSEDGNYQYKEADERSRGTDVIMHLSEEGAEFAEDGRLQQILEKYCAFMPVEIYFSKAGTEEKPEEEEKEPSKPINDTTPLWLKNPSECTKEEYSAFYRKVFNDYKEPLFYIHINADYPLNFKGILYFPRITNEFENIEGQVKLYYNQVFVADNIKEVIPEYFLMLKGVLDCPELPLNVSRSYLQNSGYVTKISQHIVKKTADKLNGLFNTAREEYEKLWNDIRLFAEYGCLRDRKFFDRVKGSLLLATTDGSYMTAEEYKGATGEKQQGKAFYTTDKITQAQYISMYRQKDIPVLVLDKMIDTQFISLLEQEYDMKFLRVDADADALKEGEEQEDCLLETLFKEASGIEELTVKAVALSDEGIPAILNISEEERRMNDFMKAYGMDTGNMKEKATLMVNSSSPLIEKLKACTDKEKQSAIAKQIYSLATLCQRQLTAEELKAFLAQSFKVLEMGL